MILGAVVGPRKNLEKPRPQGAPPSDTLDSTPTTVSPIPDLYEAHPCRRSQHRTAALAPFFGTIGLRFGMQTGAARGVPIPGGMGDVRDRDPALLEMGVT